MIQFPPCFSCKLYNDETESCKAFPDGITDDILKKKMQEGKAKECSNGIFYLPMDKKCGQ